MGDLVEDLKTLIRTRHAVVTIRTPDEAYAARVIREAGKEMQLLVMEWSVSEGLVRVEPPGGGGKIGGTESLLGVLKYLRHNDAIHLYVLKDAICHLTNPVVQRLLREVAMEFSKDNRTIFMIDAEGRLPDSMSALSVQYDLPLPDEKEILQHVRSTIRELTRYGKLEMEMSQADTEQFLANLRGLTRMEISQVVAEALLSDEKLDSDDVAKAIDLKRRRLRQSGVLDYVPPPETLPEVGGMEHLRNWLQQRRRALTDEARQFGLEPPKGILMLGVQGCGKSLMARFVAADWKMPLLRMDVGSLYDKFVGETERHLRQSFKIADAMAPCVLWIDEIEKAFASAGAGADAARSDGGLSQRIFGQLLTWMQDHGEAVFLVATANDVSALPPELMRKGRFDEIFFVDLPGDDARRSIFKIHLIKRKRDPANFDLDALLAAADGFSGAEIEQAIVSAMYAAFADRRELTNEDILSELTATSPLSVVMAEKVDTLRAWAQGRCVKAD